MRGIEDRIEDCFANNMSGEGVEEKKVEEIQQAQIVYARKCGHIVSLYSFFELVNSIAACFVSRYFPYTLPQ